MKFSCERCKTRYSIADERVRGKILKIRCKTCSSVISVREGMEDGGAGAPSVAHAEASSPGHAVPPSATVQLAAVDPPPSLHEEWFVSIDGQQEGPFGLAHAQAWVAARAASDELFCWSEGFDDWLPVEKVSHFRGLRQPLAAAMAASQARLAVPTEAKVADAKTVPTVAAAARAAAKPAEAKAAERRGLPKLDGGAALKPLPALGTKPAPVEAKPTASASPAEEPAALASPATGAAPEPVGAKASARRETAPRRSASAPHGIARWRTKWSVQAAVA